MRAGVTLPQYEVDLDGRMSVARVIEFARAAEASGFDSVWVSDHLCAIAPDGTFSGAFEASALMTHLLAATRRVEVGTLVLSASLRSVEEIACVSRALAAVAPARATLGIGTGWYAAEHEMHGIELLPYAARATHLRACVDACEGVRVLAGGSGARVLEIAAGAADAWNVAWDVDVESFRALSARLDEACARAGRDPRTVARSVGLTIALAEDSDEFRHSVARLSARAPFLRDIDADVLRARIVVGTARDCADAILRYGADEVVLAPLIRDDVDGVVELGARLLPLLR